MLWALVLCLWLFYALWLWGNYAYEYPAVTDTSILWTSTIANIVLPLIPLVVMVLLLVKQYRIGSILCGILVFLLLALGCWRSAGELLYTPAVCSYSNSAETYGDYDPWVEEFLQLNASKEFPHTLPDDAHAIQYS